MTTILVVEHDHRHDKSIIKKYVNGVLSSYFYCSVGDTEFFLDALR